MDPQTKRCKNCEQEFTIDPEDFQFYEKLKVTSPTWCPDCRQRRRYAWRNERILYRRNCDLCGKSTVTIYSANKPYKVYCPSCWWSDKWSAKEFGVDFDFTKPFFEQFQQLQLKTPRISLLTKNSVNSEYTNHGNNNKNCYRCYCVYDSEDLLYSTNVWKKAKDCCDCYHLDEGTELLYECIDCYRCYGCQFGIQLRDSTDCFYCYDCRNCQNCFMSYNLRNKQYCILNQQYSKEEYTRKVAEYKLETYEGRRKAYEIFIDIIRSKALHRFAQIEKSENVSGNMIFGSKNAKHAFDADRTEDSKFAYVSPDVKDTMDSYHYGFKCELIYESHAVVHDYKALFCHLSYDDSDIMYCDSCHNSENLFGCVGIIKGSYMIFNKQYSKEEYEALKNKIIFNMKRTGEFGEFFPPQISPFGYNETQGQVYMPMTKDEVLAKGWKWEDLIPGTFGKETLKPEDIPSAIDDVPDSLIKDALRCIKCSKNYNVVQSELQFYKKGKIPIPRLCPECRYEQRISLRPPRKLWHRQCMCSKQHPHHSGKCANEFETSYAPDREETVYCEQCYQTEVA